MNQGAKRHTTQQQRRSQPSYSSIPLSSGKSGSSIQVDFLQCIGQRPPQSTASLFPSRARLQIHGSSHQTARDVLQGMQALQIDGIRAPTGSNMRVLSSRPLQSRGWQVGLQAEPDKGIPVNFQGRRPDSSPHVLPPPDVRRIVTSLNQQWMREEEGVWEDRQMYGEICGNKINELSSAEGYLEAGGADSDSKDQRGIQRDKLTRVCGDYRMRILGVPGERASASLGSSSSFALNTSSPIPQKPVFPFRKMKSVIMKAAEGYGSVHSNGGSKKESKEEQPKPPPPEPVAAVPGEVKIDASKAHSLFYLPCLRKATKNLTFLDVLPVNTRNDSKVGIFWHDKLEFPITKFHIGRLKAGQKINRFLTMQYQARKNPLAKKLNTLQQLFPEDYNFHPVSYRFPADVNLFKKVAKKFQTAPDGTSIEGKPLYYILKPDNGSKGMGIHLAEYSKVLQTWAQMSLVKDDDEDDGDECSEPRKPSGRPVQIVKGKQNKDAKSKPRSVRIAPMPNFAAGEGRQVCVQEYVEPYLLGGHKFDLRLYVVLASVNPMRCYVCKQGMVRRAMVPYAAPDTSNVSLLHMHLTNTSLNSKFKGDASGESSSEESQDESDADSHDEAEDEEDDDDEPAACKQYMGVVMDELKTLGVDTRALWEEILRVVSLTMNAIHPEISLAYTSAFMKPDTPRSLLAKKNRRKKSAGANGGRIDSVGVLSNVIDNDRCFQIIGFDVLLSSQCKPYIIEINHNPSFKLPTPLDVDIKVAALTGCLGIVCDRLMLKPPYAPTPDTPSAIGWEAGCEDWGVGRVVKGKDHDGGLMSSRDIALLYLYTEVPSVPEPLQILDRVCKLFEAVCTHALLISFELQSSKAEEEQNASRNMLFGSTSGTSKARRAVDVLSLAELRDKDCILLQDLFARARLPMGLPFDVRHDFKAIFPMTRTPVATVLLLDGFCEGLVEMSRHISRLVNAGQIEEKASPKGAPEERGNDVTGMKYKILSIVSAMYTDF